MSAVSIAVQKHGSFRGRSRKNAGTLPRIETESSRRDKLIQTESQLTIKAESIAKDKSWLATARKIDYNEKACSYYDGKQQTTRAKEVWWNCYQ